MGKPIERDNLDRVFPPEPAMGDWHADWAAIDDPPTVTPDDDGEES